MSEELEYKEAQDYHPSELVVTLAKYRQLEYELAAVTADLKFRRELGALQQQEYDKVTAERDALKAKLATINHVAMSLFVRSTGSEVTGEMAEIGRLSREDGQ